MAKSESARECKKHPNHKSLPGICPSCLREKLQQFHNQPSSYSDSASAFSSSSSEFFFSGNSSRRRRHRRNASEMVVGSTAADFFGDPMKKSGSIGILAGDGAVDGDCGAGGGKKKSGFWSKLLVRPKAWHFHSQPKVSSREIVG